MMPGMKRSVRPSCPGPLAARRARTRTSRRHARSARQPAAPCPRRRGRRPPERSHRLRATLGEERVDFEFTDEQLELQANARAVLAAACPPSLVRDVYEARGDGQALWKQLVELGWPALGVGEEHGGLGLGFIEVAVVVEELGRVVAPAPFLATVTQLVPAIRESGSGEPQRGSSRPSRRARSPAPSLSRKDGVWRTEAVQATARPIGRRLGARRREVPRRRRRHGRRDRRGRPASRHVGRCRAGRVRGPGRRGERATAAGHRSDAAGGRRWPSTRWRCRPIACCSNPAIRTR